MFIRMLCDGLRWVFNVIFFFGVYLLICLKIIAVRRLFWVWKDRRLSYKNNLSWSGGSVRRWNDEWKSWRWIYKRNFERLKRGLKRGLKRNG